MAADSEEFGPTEDGKTSDGRMFVSVGKKVKREPTTEAAASDAVNLVPFFKQKDLKEMGQRVWDLYCKDVAKRKPRMAKIRKYLELYASLLKPKSHPWQNAANINLPILTYPLLQVQARLYDMVWPEDGKVIFSSPSSTNDMQRAEVTEKFANGYIRNHMPEMEQWLDDSLAQMCLVGSAIRRTFWDPYEERVRSDWIPLEDFVVAWDCRSQDPSLRGVPRYTLVHHMTLADLELYGNAGVYENVDGLKHEDGDGTKEAGELDETKRKLDGSSGDADDDDPDRARMVLEQHCRWRMPDTGKHPAFDGKIHYLIITVDEPTKRVLRVVLREEDDPKDAQRYAKEEARFNEWRALSQPAPMAGSMGVPVAADLGPPPFGVDKKGNPNPPRPTRKREVCFFTHYRAFFSEGFYGLGFGDFIAPLAEAGNRLINGHINGVELRNSKPGFISRQLRTQRGPINVGPGVFNEVDGPIAAMKDGIFFMDPPLNDPTTMPLIKMVIELGEKLFASADLMSGSTSGANRTAKEIQILNAQMMKQITVLARRVKGAFKHELDKIWRCWGVFLPDEPETMSVVDPATGQPEELPISRQLFIPDARVVPAADPRMRFEKIEEAQQRFGFVMQNPMLAQNPVAFYEATADVMRSIGGERIMANVQKPKPPPPPQPLPHFEEEARWLQGQSSPTHPDDNDDEHKAMHIGFLQSPRAQMMDKNQRAMAEQHLRDHDAQAIRKAGQQMMQQQQMMAQQMGQMGGPMPQGPVGP